MRTRLRRVTVVAITVLAFGAVSALAQVSRADAAGGEVLEIGFFIGPGAAAEGFWDGAMSDADIRTVRDLLL